MDIFVQVGVFQKFSGEEFESFMTLAEKLRADYDFSHTLDAKLLPRGESVNKPTLRLLKPFDELFVDFHVLLNLSLYISSQSQILGTILLCGFFVSNIGL